MGKVQLELSEDTLKEFFDLGAQIKKLEKRKKEIKEAEDRAAAKAIQDEKDRIAKEEKDKKRKAARLPDKERLLNLGILMLQVPFPEMKTEEGQSALEWFGPELMKLVKELKKKAEAL